MTRNLSVQTEWGEMENSRDINPVLREAPPFLIKRKTIKKYLIKLHREHSLLCEFGAQASYLLHGCKEILPL